MSVYSKRKMMTLAGVVIVATLVYIAYSLGMVSSLMRGLLVPICVYVIMAASLNLTVGILGELSLGHAGFMCVGAFAGSFFSMWFADSMPNMIRFVMAILVGAISTALCGIIIGIPVLRLKGDYLAIVTLAFGEIIKNLVNVLYVGRDSTGIKVSIKNVAALGLEDGGQVIIKGPQGITGTPNDSSFVIGIILTLLILIIIFNIVESRTGRAIMSIRDNRIAAESVGINVSKYKLMAFAISASMAGVAGVLYSHNISTLTAQPKNFGYNMSILILVFVVLGGIGNITGSVISAVALTLLPELLRGMSDYRMLIYSIVLVIMMLLNWSPGAKLFKEIYLGKLLGKFKVRG